MNTTTTLTAAQESKISNLIANKITTIDPTPEDRVNALFEVRQTTFLMMDVFDTLDGLGCTDINTHRRKLESIFTSYIDHNGRMDKDTFNTYNFFIEHLSILDRHWMGINALAAEYRDLNDNLDVFEETL